MLAVSYFLTPGRAARPNREAKDMLNQTEVFELLMGQASPQTMSSVPSIRRHNPIELVRKVLGEVVEQGPSEIISRGPELGNSIGLGWCT